MSNLELNIINECINDVSLKYVKMYEAVGSQHRCDSLSSHLLAAETQVFAPVLTGINRKDEFSIM